MFIPYDVRPILYDLLSSALILAHPVLIRGTNTGIITTLTILGWGKLRISRDCQYILLLSVEPFRGL